MFKKNKGTVNQNEPVKPKKGKNSYKEYVLKETIEPEIARIMFNQDKKLQFPNNVNALNSGHDICKEVIFKYKKYSKKLESVQYSNKGIIHYQWYAQGHDLRELRPHEQFHKLFGTRCYYGTEENDYVLYFETFALTFYYVFEPVRKIGHELRIVGVYKIENKPVPDLKIFETMEHITAGRIFDKYHSMSHCDKHHICQADVDKERTCVWALIRKYGVGKYINIKASCINAKIQRTVLTQLFSIEFQIDMNYFKELKCEYPDPENENNRLTFLLVNTKHKDYYYMAEHDSEILWILKGILFIKSGSFKGDDLLNYDDLLPADIVKKNNRYKKPTDNSSVSEKPSKGKGSSVSGKSGKGKN